MAVCCRLWLTKRTLRRQDLSMDIHEIARNGTRPDMEFYVERLKTNASVDSDDFQEYIRSFVNTKNDHKYSPLHCSIFSRSSLCLHCDHWHSLTPLRNLDTFSCLVELGCDVNAKCHGSSPLHLLIATATLPNGGKEFGVSGASALIAAGCDLHSKVIPAGHPSAHASIG